VLFVLALLPSAHAEVTCDGPTPEQAAQALAAAKDDYAQARHVVYETDWQYRLAIEDRDLVMGERKQAIDTMHAKKASLRGAKHDSKTAEARVADCGTKAPAKA
jgi:hypothetical protein